MPLHLASFIHFFILKSREILKYIFLLELLKKAHKNNDDAVHLQREKKKKKKYGKNCVFSC